MSPAATLQKKASKSEETPAKKSKVYYIPTPKTKAFNDLVGGIPVGTITSFLGAPESCKTVTATQLAVEAAVAGEGNLLIFDTENKFHQHLGLASGLSERFNADITLVRVSGEKRETGSGDTKKTTIDWEFEDEPNPNGTNIFIVHCPDLIELSIMFGRGILLEVFESGKYKVKIDSSAVCTDITKSPIGQFLTKHNIKALVVDSFTNPFDIIPAVGENFPARADATQIWMIQMHNIAYKFHLPILVTLHESKNDTSPFSKQLKYEGGKGVGYNLPFIIYLLKVNEIGLLPKSAAKPKTLASSERAMFIARHGSNTIKPWAEVRYLKVGDTGMSDGSGDDEE